MSTKNPTMIGRAQRRPLTNLGALLLFAAPITAFSSGCGNVGPETDAESNLGQTQQALTSCVTLNATADAMLSDPPKSQNYGSHPLLRVGGKDESLIKFDLDSIPAQAAINSATLKLYASGVAGSNQVNIHAANASWNESTVSFQSFNQQFDGAVAGIINPSSSTTYKTADLTGLVNAWRSGAKANNGILLERDGNQKVQFSSRDASGSAGPTLTVCYTTPDDNHCAPNPCVNGTCTNTQSSYTCACAPGWTGTNCDTNIDECAANPCQNGGSCTDGSNSYTCACAPGYAGANCETNIDECASAPCQNGGVCTDGVNSYSCSCEPGYAGANCETNIDECAGAPCLNDGTCTDGSNSYTCACPAGFTGTNCETDIDECASSPCVHGACIDQINSYTCSCDPGFDGANCENNIDECASEPCLNGGSCTDGFFSYTCACAPGYEGTNCEIDINDCAVNPCQHDGICVDGVNKYTCSCPVGWIGASCETEAVFAPPVKVATGTTPAERIADFNHDGHLDVLTTGAAPSPLRLALGNGDGTFQASTNAGYTLGAIGAFTIGDYNGDGNVDIVAHIGGSIPGTSDAWFVLGLGNGDGTFQYQNFGLPGGRDLTNPNTSMITGDWNGDGHLDLVSYTNSYFPTSTPPRLFLNLGNGDGSFQSNTEILTLPIAYDFRSPVAADFNGDGHLDLAFTNLGDGTKVLLGNGDGTFQSPLSYGVVGELVSGLTVDDVNGDGAPDLVTRTGANGGSIRSILNNGDGTFQIGSATQFSGVTSVAVGDWDGDGHADIAGPKPALGLVSVRLGNGDGTFQAEGLYTGFTAHPVFGPRSISARDFDENGSLDLLVGGVIGGLNFMRNLNAAIDPCNPNPCQNGGTCNNDGNGGYTCTCSSIAWSGPDCATSECPCVDSPDWSQQAINGISSCVFWDNSDGKEIAVATPNGQSADVAYSPIFGSFCADSTTMTPVTEAQALSCRALLLEREAAGSNYCAPCLDMPTATCIEYCDVHENQLFCF